MSKPSEHNKNIWLSLEQLIKYVKGNLLGSKKQEVEDKITASPLLSDAAEGIGQAAQPEKLQNVIDSLNRQIQLKSGAAAVGMLPQDDTAGSPATQKLSGKAMLSIAASVVILTTAGAAIWWGLSTSSSPNNSAMVRAELEQKIDSDVVPGKKDDNTDKKFANDRAANGNQIAMDTLSDTSAGLLALFDERTLENIDSDEEVAPIEDDTERDGSNKYLNMSNKSNTSAERKDALAKERQREEAISPASILENNAEPLLENESTNGVNLNRATNLSYNTPETSPDVNESYGYNSEDLSKVSVEKNDRYKKAESTSTDADAYTAALSLLDAGKLDEAEVAFDDIASNRSSAFQDDAYWNLAQIYLKQDDSKSAKKVLKKIKNSAKYGIRAKQELDKL